MEQVEEFYGRDLIYDSDISNEESSDESESYGSETEKKSERDTEEKEDFEKG